MNVVKVDEQSKTPSKKKGSIAMRDIVIFTRQFSTMINAGLPLVQALDILAEAVGEPGPPNVTRRWCSTSSRATPSPTRSRKHPNAFTELYVNMVAAGEAGGILDTILMRLATFMEKNDALVRKVKGAMIYPGVIMSVAGTRSSVLLIFVIPTFQSMFASVGLPCRSRRASSSRSRSSCRATGGRSWAGFVGTALQELLRHANGQLAIDRLMLKAPVLGDVLRKSAVSRFTRTLGTLISSGVSILDGLEITAKTAGNRVVQTRSWQSRSSIAGGDTIAGPLAEVGRLPAHGDLDDRRR
jgi:type IV pilus assembly protein PilC